MTPRQSIEAECDRRGRAAVIDGCIGLLLGHPTDDDLIRALGGPAADQVLAGREGGRHGYWPRVWAARGLLHAWDYQAGADPDPDPDPDPEAEHTNADKHARAVAALLHATTDDSWRVRELAAKVAARHRVGDALTAVAALRDDPVPRVRDAATKAVEILTAARA